MSRDFRWVGRGAVSRQFDCESDARDWSELHPAMVAGWIQFAEVLGKHAPEDVRTKASLALFASSGRVVFHHGKRESPKGVPWYEIPTDYIWSVQVSCLWVEESLDAEYRAEEAAGVRSSGATNIAHARCCLLAAADGEVARAFQKYGIGDIPVHGKGVTQSPAPFELRLSDLFAGDPSRIDRILKP